MNLRKDRRAQIECPVSFTGDNLSGEGITCNVSTQGCAIRSGTYLAPGVYLALRIGFPGNPTPLPVEMAAVRWSHQSEFGVHFVAMEESERDRLRRILGKVEGTAGGTEDRSS
jgi:PilZ domain-containing protein